MTLSYTPALNNNILMDTDNNWPITHDNTFTEKPSHQRNISLTPSLTQATNSRYSKASFTLTHHPEAIKMYREAALKTNDTSVQLTYAKYLLEIAHLYDDDDDDKRPTFQPNLSLTTLSRLRRDSFSSAMTSVSSIDTHVSAPPSEKEQDMCKQKKKKMLEEEGVRWIKRLAKARVGEASYLLGLWYDRGLYGLRKSTTRALKYYQIAAKQKVPEAMFAVGQQHEKNQDYMTSFQLYEEAASLGLVEALYRIAMINLNGEFGSRRNIVGAIQLLVKASEKSSGTCPEAPYTLGLLLLNEYPSTTLPSEVVQTYGGTFAAMTYLEYAAEMGMSLAQYRLGYIYEHGLYTIRTNITKAYTYYELAANSNHDGYSMIALSRIHNHGVKVPPEQLEEQLALFESDESNWTKNHARNETEAFKWCQMAAKQNIPEACYLLGWYYELGIGVPRDFSKAYHYYSKAIKKGDHKEAKERVHFLETMLKYQKKAHQEEKKASVIHQKNRDSQCHIM